jgi:hypothetical protein
MSKALLLVVALSGLTLALTGCTSESTEPDQAQGDEAALTEAKTLAKGVAYPSGLATGGGHVFFGSNKFNASGDPELDQEFAYWSGKFSKVALTGGRPVTVADIGPVTKVRRAGNKLFYGTADGCWISALDVGGSGDGTQVYRDENCEPEWGRGPRGFEIANDKLVVVSEDGTVSVGSLTGANMHKIAEIRVGDSGNVVETHALADDAIAIVTQQHLGQNHDQPQQLFRVKLSNGAKTKVLDFAKQPSNFTSDGKNLYWSEEGKSVFVLKAGSSTPELVKDGFAEITSIASDGKNVFVADSKRDAMYVVYDALTAERRQKKLAVAKGLTDMIFADGSLYFGTHVIENRKAAGIIGSVKVPQP